MRRRIYIGNFSYTVFLKLYISKSYIKEKKTFPLAKGVIFKITSINRDYSFHSSFKLNISSLVFKTSNFLIAARASNHFGTCKPSYVLFEYAR